MMKTSTIQPSLEFSPALKATITPDERARLLPVDFQPMDVLSEPEPSIGTLIELDNGQVAAIVYGELTNTLTIELPPSGDPARHLVELLREVPIDTEAITWINPSVLQPTGPGHARMKLERTIATDSGGEINLAAPTSRDVRDAEIIAEILRLAS